MGRLGTSGKVSLYWYIVIIIFKLKLKFLFYFVETTGLFKKNAPISLRKVQATFTFSVLQVFNMTTVYNMSNTNIIRNIFYGHISIHWVNWSGIWPSISRVWSVIYSLSIRGYELFKVIKISNLDLLLTNASLEPFFTKGVLSYNWELNGILWLDRFKYKTSRNQILRWFVTTSKASYYPNASTTIRHFSFVISSNESML